MKSSYLQLAKDYAAGHFREKPEDRNVSVARWKALNTQFFQNHDDWYHPYYARHTGNKNVEAVQAITQLCTSAFYEVYAHMPLCYINCAISSGTNAHHDAVSRDHHTSDRLGRVVGNDWHLEQNILPNSLRALQRAREMQDHVPEYFYITPPAFETTTRIISNNQGKTITGGMPFDGADYMSFWNTAIDLCTALTLDDIRKDAPTQKEVLEEIKLAQNGTAHAPKRKPVETTDWVNSRNSILEMYRMVIAAFDLHPLRNDAKDIKILLYNEETDNMRPARLLDCAKPLIQNILRWTPQGIATEESCRTVARLFNLHRMRTSPRYNAEQIAPLDLKRISPLYASPSQREVKEMDRLIAAFEPYLLQYCPHLIRTEGLPPSYAKAKAAHPVTEKDIGKKTMEWQRTHIPASETKRLWKFTKATRHTSVHKTPQRPSHAPPRRTHDFNTAPFDEKLTSKIWEDNPYPLLSEMEQALLSVIIGAIDTGLMPLDQPDFHGVVHDSKRGPIAQKHAKKAGVYDLAALPGVLGTKFKRLVKTPNTRAANKQIEKLRHTKDSDTPSVVLSSTHIGTFNDNIDTIWHKLFGPGQEPSANFRLALMMKMMDRNMTKVSFQNGWETSESSTQLMLRATLIELNQIKRPFDGQNEIQPLDYKGNYISLHERYEKLRHIVKEMSNSPYIKKLKEENNTQALERAGIRQITVALARIMEIHDCYTDPTHNNDRFDFHRMSQTNLKPFKKDISRIQESKEETRNMLLNDWVWMWSETDFRNLRNEYEQHWKETHGRQAQHAGPRSTFTKAIQERGRST